MKSRDVPSAPETPMLQSSVDAIPDAWPLLLNRNHLCAFLAISPATLSCICPVAPLALGVKLLRWRRTDIELWVSGLPTRSVNNGGEEIAAVLAPAEMAGEERRSEAVDRARLRALRKAPGTTWH